MLSNILILSIILSTLQLILSLYFDEFIEKMKLSLSCRNDHVNKSQIESYSFPTDYKDITSTVSIVVTQQESKTCFCHSVLIDNWKH